MFHFQIRRLLSAYADGELDQPISEQIKVHVQRCASCLDDIENILLSKQAVSLTTNTPSPERIWQKIEKKLFRTITGESVVLIYPIFHQPIEINNNVIPAIAEASLKL